jgi:protein-disulfide isomerase
MVNKNRDKYNKKKGVQNLWLIIAAVVTVAIIVIAYVSLSAASNSDNKNGAEAFKTAPQNVIQDGISIGQDFKALSTSTPGEPLDSTFENTPYQPIDGKTTLKLFIDPQCPICNTFESTNGETIDKYIKSGDVVVEYHPISFLDQASTTKYSSRATNALACVADEQPDTFYGFLKELFVNQPAEGGAGLTNNEIYKVAVQSGVEGTTELKTCIDSKQFAPWVEAATNRALQGPIPGTTNGVVQGTPAVFINGEQINIAPNDAAGFTSVLEEAINSNK